MPLAYATRHVVLSFFRSFVSVAVFHYLLEEGTFVLYLNLPCCHYSLFESNHPTGSMVSTSKQIYEIVNICLSSFALRYRSATTSLYLPALVKMVKMSPGVP
jgi:hypothetical protein